MQANDDAFEKLAASLRDRLAIIGDRDLRESDSAVQLERLREVSERIALIQAALPQPIDPHLAHFLQRCSYDKALSWIEQRRSAPG